MPSASRQPRRESRLTRLQTFMPLPNTGVRCLALCWSARCGNPSFQIRDAIVMRVQFELNGTSVEADVEPRTTLADCIRNDCRQTGTHLGCEHGVCGSCTVLVNGDAVRSCLILAVQAQGEKVTTVEGLSSDDGLSPLQASFRRHHALQCGFCTPGFITTAHALLSKEPGADANRIREVLSGNLCRCTGYIPIVEAVLDARSAYGYQGDPS
jgi:aerobic-type carbon monoxide dehydrogenase small subunit (CoxS/CutS family)